MSVKYKLVSKKNLGKDQKEIPEKMYAQMICGDLVAFDEFVEEVADSTIVGSAGVKAVLDRVNVVLVRHLQHGRRVNVGELGNFRLNFGSEGVTDAEAFDTTLIREPRVRFFPGRALRTIKSRVGFEKIVLKPAADDTEGGKEDPDENPDIL